MQSSSIDVFAFFCTSVICLGTWALIAGGAGYLAHRRVRSIERALGKPAQPPGEGPLLWYAGAAVAWPVAGVLALVGLVSRERARVGRNCFYVMLGHFTAATVGALGAVFVQPDGLGAPEDMIGIVYIACFIVGVSAIAAATFAWLWAGSRARRIEAEATTGAAPDLWVRAILYVGSAVFWPAGLISAAVFAKPENASVGATAFRISLLQVVGIAIAVCIGLPIAIAHLT